jgi:diketogulonate reductase-like aldo/keto reductase
VFIDQIDYDYEHEYEMKTISLPDGERDATPAQIALAWVLRHPNIIAIPKATKERRIRDNARSIAIELTKEDVADLDREFPPPRSKELLPTL